MNYEGSYLVKGFLYISLHFYPFSDNAFAELGVLTRTSNKFLVVVAVAECYLITTHVKSKETKKQPLRIHLSIKLAIGKMPIEQKSIPSHLIYNIDSLSKMAWKTESFSEKIS